jgi:hypothetical protein
MEEKGNSNSLDTGRLAVHCQWPVILPFDVDEPRLPTVDDVALNLTSLLCWYLVDST